MAMGCRREPVRPSKIPQSGPAAAWAASGVEDMRIEAARMEDTAAEWLLRSWLLLTLDAIMREDASSEERLRGSNEEVVDASPSTIASMNVFFS